MSGNTNGNDNDVDVDIEIMVTFSRQVFEAAQSAITTMQDGERIQIKQLAQSVGLAVARDAKDVLGFVNHFAHHTSLAYVTRGKNGGIIKGTKPVKVVKVGKKQKKDMTLPVVEFVAGPAVVTASFATNNTND
jgi:hypothetical protein